MKPTFPASVSDPKALPAAGDGELLLAIDQIAPHPRNARHDFDQGELESLAHSFDEAGGLLQRPVVRPARGQKGKPYQLVFGERRLRAAELAGYKRIPVILCEALDDRTALKMLGAENLNRSNWNPVEKAAYVKSLSEPTSAGGAGMTDQEIASHLKRSAGWVKTHRRLLDLPEFWRRRLASGAMKVGEARHLLPYLEQPEALKAFEKDVQENPWGWTDETRVKVSVRRLAEDKGAMTRHTRRFRSRSAPRPKASATEGSEPTRPASKAARQKARKFAALLRPYRHSREDLEAIRDLAQTLIDELDGEREGDR